MLQRIMSSLTGNNQVSKRRRLWITGSTVNDENQSAWSRQSSHTVRDTANFQSRLGQ